MRSREQSALWSMRHGRTANIIIAVYGAVLLALAGYAWLSGLANPLVVLLVGVVGPMVVACGALFAVFIVLLIYEGTSHMLTDIIGAITDWRNK